MNINSKKFLYNLEFVWCEYEDDVNDLFDEESGFTGMSFSDVRDTSNNVSGYAGMHIGLTAVTNSEDIEVNNNKLTLKDFALTLTSRVGYVTVTPAVTDVTNY